MPTREERLGDVEQSRYVSLPGDGGAHRGKPGTLARHEMDLAASSGALSIRSFEEGDRPALEQLWEAVFPDDPPRNAPRTLIDNKLKVQPELLLVGHVEGTVVGAVIAGFDGVRGWIYHLAVAPEWRRRGFATQLVSAAEAGLRRLGCPKVNLQVRATNVTVVAFYRSVGYEIEERLSMGRPLDAGG